MRGESLSLSDCVDYCTHNVQNLNQLYRSVFVVLYCSIKLGICASDRPDIHLHTPDRHDSVWMYTVEILNRDETRWTSMNLE